MKDIFTLFNPFSGAWIFGIKYAPNFSRKNGTGNYLWIEIRLPFEHTSHFHRLKILLNINENI